MAPLVSILIPTYNRPKDIEKAISSCLAQVYENIEIIITDNSNNNETKEVLRKFNSGKLKYYKNATNLGPILNWKKALELSIGEWLVILPDDDYFINSFYISDCINIINENKIDFIITDCILGYPTSNSIGRSNKNGIVASQTVLDEFWKSIHIPTIANFFSRKIIKDINFFYSNDILYSDIELWLKILCKSENVYFYNIPSVYYTFHDENIVKTMSVNSLINNALLFCETFHDNRVLRNEFLKRYLLFISSIYPSYTQELILKLKTTYKLDNIWYLSVKLAFMKKKVKNIIRKFIN